MRKAFAIVQTDVLLQGVQGRSIQGALEEAVKKKKGLSWDEVIKGMAETGLSYVDYIKKYEDEV